MNKPLNKDVKGPFLSLGLSMAVLDIIEPLFPLPYGIEDFIVIK